MTNLLDDRWWRRLASCGLATLAAAAAAWPLDADLVRVFNPDGPGWWSPVLSALHHVMPLAMLTVAVLLGGKLWLSGRTVAARRLGCLLAIGPFAANRVTTVLKDIVGRPRPQAPDHGIENLWILIKDADDRSFPSGHVTTTAAFAIALMLVLSPRRFRAAVLLLVPLMMWDRIALAVHFPSDTLAGVGIACLSVAAMILGLRRIDPRIPERFRVPGAVVVLLAITWAWSGGTRPVDPVSHGEVTGVRLEQTWTRAALEPFVGPPLEVAWAPGPRQLAYDLLPWALLGALLLWFLPPVPWRRRRLWCAGVLVLIWGLGFWSGRLPADRFVSDVDGVFFDPHVHGSDPVDGARDVRFVLDRARARGVDVVALTNHDAPPPVPDALAGLEWSGGLHGSRTYLHLLVYGGSGAFDAVMDQEIANLRVAADSVRIALAAVTEAKAHGAIVIVAHYWRTLARMELEGTADHLPTPEQLVAAGADGFEIGNRHWEADPEGREGVEGLDALCRDRGLLRLSSSDDHGIPAGSPCITFLPGVFPGDPVARRTAVFERLAARGEAWPVVFMREKPAERPAAVIAGPVFLVRYFAALSFWGRLSWLLWFLAVLSWLRRRDRGAGQPPSSEPAAS